MRYTCWLLSDATRARLLGMFPPQYPDVVAHHVTEKLNASETDPLPEGTTATIIGVADDGIGVQTLIVDMGNGCIRADDEIYHITWSLDRAAGFKPKDSKQVAKLFRTDIAPVKIDGLIPAYRRG